MEPQDRQLDTVPKYMIANSKCKSSWGRTEKNRLSTIVVCSLLMGACPALGDTINSPGQPESNKVRLAIAEFEKLGGDPKFDLLGRGLPQMLAISLIPNQKIQYVERREFETAARRKYTGQQTFQDADPVLDRALLDELAIELLLRGHFIEYRDQIRIGGRLIDRESETIIDLSSRTVDVRGINSAIEQFAKELDSAVASLSAQKRAKRLAVICFEDTSDVKGDSNDWLAQDIPISLLSYLELTEEIIPLPWSESKPLCGVDFDGDREILATSNADAIIRGEYRFSGSEITIVPELVIREKKIFRDAVVPLALTEVTGQFENYWALQDSLAVDVSNVLDAILENGKWNVDALTFEGQGPEQYFEKGLEQLENDGNTYVAALMFINATKKNPEFAAAHYQLGRARLKQERDAEALESFSRAIEIEPDFADAYVGVADVYTNRGDYGSAVSAIERVVEIAPERSDTYRTLGELMYLLDENDDAVVQLNRALEINDQDVEAHILLGNIFRSRGDEDKAIKSFSVALQLEPASAEARASLADIHRVRGQNLVSSAEHRAAVRNFREALRYEQDSNTYVWLIFALNQIEDYAESAVAFGDAVSAGVANASVYNMAANTLYLQERYEEALAMYEKSLDLDPSDAVVIANRAWALSALLRYVEALDAFQAAIDADPGDVRSLLGKGYLLLMLGRFDEALTLAERAISLSPDDPRGYNEKSVLLAELERYEESVAAADKAIELDEEMANPYNHKGFSLYRLGRRADGIELIEQSIELNPDYGGTHYNLARIYADDDKIDLALDSLAEATRINADYRARARADEDFELLQDNARFQALVGTN